MAVRSNNYSGNKMFLNIIGGKFARKVKSEDGEKYGKVVQRTNKEGKIVQEVYYDELDISVTKIGIEGSNFGDNLVLYGEDGDENYVVQIPVESRYFNSFCDKIHNIDFNRKLTLKPYSFQSDKELNKNGEPKQITGINVFNGGQKVEKYYTKDSPHDKPIYPEGGTQSQLKKYYIDQEDFFREQVKQVAEILEKRQNGSGNGITNGKQKVEVTEHIPDNVEDGDSLPF